MTPTGAEEGEGEPLNALTGNSNGNGNGEPLLTLKNVCLNFGINENSGLITQYDDDGNGDGPTTCEECFEKKLSSKSLKDLLGYLSGVGWGLTEFCDELADQEGEGAIELAVTLTLQVVQISDSEIQNVIECLKKIGFIPPPPPPVDTEPPNVLSFTAEPFRVSFSSGGTITITAHVTDATGVQRVGVFIQDECGGSPGFFQSFELPRVAGTLRDGTYQSTFTFPESALDVNHFCNPNLAFQIGGVVTDTLGNGKGLPLIGVILEP
jgi:hypothetical protein